MKKNFSLLIIFVALSLLFSSCKDFGIDNNIQSSNSNQNSSDLWEESQGYQGTNPELDYEDLASQGQISLSAIADYKGSPHFVIDDNCPDFSKSLLRSEAFEYYGNLDEFGRCTGTVACVGRETMPTEPRGEIGMIRPTGWQISKYESVDGQYLYNRCHLIGFQLTGENANPKNLITGTRYMNVQGMLPFENQIADYVKSTGNHVLYRVTPIFEGDNLLAHGVRMEAVSLEDGGEGVCFDVFCYNVQPRIAIDYTNGDNEYAGVDDYEIDGEITYILNTSSKKFHKPTCSAVEDIKESNRQTTTKSASALVSEGYSPCGKCG